MTKNRLADSRPQNKLKRQALHLSAKKKHEAEKRDFRLRRKREEAKNPKLRIKRQAQNVPQTIDKKRRWDEVDEEATEGTGLGLAVDVDVFKRRRLDHELLDGAEGRGKMVEKEGLTEDKLKEKDELEAKAVDEVGNGEEAVEGAADEASESEFSEFDSDEEEEQLPSDAAPHTGDQKRAQRNQPNGVDEAASNNDSDQDQPSHSDDDLESIIQEPSEDEATSDDDKTDAANPPDAASTASAHPAPSATSTYVSLIPDALASKFPSLFAPPSKPPKILITTSLGGTIHREASLFCDFIPNATYVKRQAHRYKSHHYSLREISKYAWNREFTTLLVLNEDHKRVCGMTAIVLPSGPTLHFSINNWVEGKAIPGHGRPTPHPPELILNNFRTPLGLLTAHFFRSLFPPSPDLRGRQVVTLHNQRDYIFVRRHRYAFREKRKTEKSVTDPGTGKAVRGVEEVKAGLQELGPRFSMKLRRVDRGVQRVSGQEWEWRAGMEKVRTRFNL